MPHHTPLPHQKSRLHHNRRRKPRSRCLLPVYSSSSRSTACTSCASTRTRGTRRPGATRAGASTGRARTRPMNWRRCGRSFSPVCVLCPLVFARRGGGVSRRWRRVDGVYVGSRLRSGLGRKLGRTRGHARAPTRVFRDTTHERAPSTPHAIDAGDTTRTQRRRTGAARSSRSSPRSSRSAARRKKGVTWACSGGAR